MKPRILNSRGARAGSTFVIVLWIAFGLVSLTLYFAQSMSLELRAGDHRVCGLAAEQAIDGAARYLSVMLASRLTNGTLPEPETYACEDVAVGEARFWLIGRDTNATGYLTFGLVDEASRINLNTATSNMLYYIPGMDPNLVEAILDWRDTNGGTGAFDMQYSLSQPGYANKCSPFETVEELHLLYGADLYTINGEDANRNGILDPDEVDEDRNGVADPGIVDYVTVYSREPNTYSNGTPRINISNLTDTTTLQSLLQGALGSSRAQEVLNNLGLAGGGGGAGAQFRSPLEFYSRSRMSADEFALVANCLTTTNGAYIEGRINVNTAHPSILACLPGIVDNPSLAETLADYRESNPTRLSSVAWVADALGQNNQTALQALMASDCLTTASYQFSADIAAVGPHGRGYRRTRLVFDTCDGVPKVVFRQDLTHLGWALGSDVRQWAMAAGKEKP